ncbi:MFS transporter [Stappia sp. GBMRC 2046]|uniref:MFS transporter n=1 Tax=Stappia sediminis TaxID=2692190 RepID=A0A7X3LWE6_9HYPH|nr:MFS transporter [Stappia sediminis]
MLSHGCKDDHIVSKGYTLSLLTAVFAINQLDRQILGITLEAIGQEFDLSDTKLGILSGLAFAVVFGAFGLPIARLAARGNRRNIISLSLIAWSGLTAATAGAQNFTHLALARIGVGIGEAGGVAPAHSMITDLYPPEKRTSAMATFVSGGNIGILLAFLIGGIVGQEFGWRWAFVVAGVPGILLAFLLRFTVREPERDISVKAGEQNRSLFIATSRAIFDDPGLRCALFAISLTGVVTFGALAWTPTFAIRALGLSQAQAGIFLALSVGIGGGLGTWFSGRVADRLGTSDPRWRLGIAVAGLLAAKPFILGFLLLESRPPALGCLVVATLFAGIFWAPTFVFLHSRIPSHMRPMATAIFIFAFNLVGVGMGPTVVGLASDTIFSGFGSRSLGVSLAVIQAVGVAGAWFYWKAMRTIS